MSDEPHYQVSMTIMNSVKMKLSDLRNVKVKYDEDPLTTANAAIREMKTIAGVIDHIIEDFN